jgi:hypothetical protein
MMTLETTGPHGIAWRVSANSSPAIVAQWIVEARWAHPLWHLYLIAVCHLRDVAGCPSPIIHAPGSTHEISVWAIDPAWNLNLQQMPPRLHPANFAGQFREACDGLAEQLVEAAVLEILEGKLSPDTDFMRDWINRFGSACVKPEYL